MAYVKFGVKWVLQATQIARTPGLPHKFVKHPHVYFMRRPGRGLPLPLL